MGAANSARSIHKTYGNKRMNLIEKIVNDSIRTADALIAELERKEE